LTIKGVVSLTGELQTVGTPNYMSPEQIRSSEALDLRTDIYSLGATFYHMLTGRPPFVARTAMAVVAQHLSTPLTPPIEVREELPEAISSIICKMMAKHPAERYQNYDEYIADLENALAGRTIAAEGFEESQTGFEDEASLREILGEIKMGASIELDEDELPSAPPAREETARQPAAKAARDIAPFGPGDFAAYEPPPEESGESTVLAQQILRPQRDRGPLIMGLLIVGLVVLILLVGILVLWLGG
ncbi:MAG: hypothetical protein AMK73_07625, partial [Planctomycetes bacterium SM23_32]